MNLTRKILQNHLVAGQLEPGSEVAIRIDQALLQDATGTVACLEFEAMGIPAVKTQLAVVYVDHNTLQTDAKNADDHVYLQDVAAKYGMYFSRPGNGICHQVHLERFSVPGETLLGSDSHTPTCGAVGMIAIGAGGLDVACALAGAPFYLRMPKVVGVELRGRLGPWVSAKDVILELLRRLTVKGGVGRIFEYWGEALRFLEVPERATIANMGAELGATTSIFPSDDVTRRFFAAQGREHHFSYWLPDPDADYDERLALDLDALEPLIARPPSPDNVCPVRELAGTPVDQVVIGSCTNSSYQDLMTVASLLRGRTVHPRVSLVISPGSRQVYQMIAQNGALADLIAAGARMLEPACGPCPGMGQTPPSGGVSVRSFNRNFPGRCGSLDAQVYLASPAVCAACAITGVITDPRSLFEPIVIRLPDRYWIDDRMILPPARDGGQVEIRRGPNIKPLPTVGELEDCLTGAVLIKLGNDVTTDDILPAGAEILPLRSNIPAIAQFVFHHRDRSFPQRAKERGGGFIVAGHNYGQGSSREHAAIAPMYLGVRAVLAKSFGRIHVANLINFRILPLTFEREADYEVVQQDDQLVIEGVTQALQSGSERLWVHDRTRDIRLPVRCDLTERQRAILLAGGLLNYARRAQAG